MCFFVNDFVDVLGFLDFFLCGVMELVILELGFVGIGSDEVKIV